MSRRSAVERLEPRWALASGPSLPTTDPLAVFPALFAENDGQWPDASIRFAHHGSDANVFVSDSGLQFQLLRRERLPDAPATPGQSFTRDAAAVPSITSTTIATDAVVQFSASYVGAHRARPIGLDRSSTQVHYLLGDPSQWRSRVAAFEAVAYKNLYDAIDLHVFGRRNRVKYEFHVAPGGDWSQIQVRYDGIAGLSLATDGSLIVDVDGRGGRIADAAPLVYQQIAGQRIEIPSRFVLLDNQTFAFDIAGDYDPARELVIDPDLSWGGFLGGNFSDRGYDVAVDADGNALIVGTTASPSWATGSLRGIDDAFVAKVSPTGALLWNAYLGGDGGDGGARVAVDSQGNVLVIGETTSSGWVAGGYDTQYGAGGDGFLVKLDPQGRHLWSTYLGGGGGDSGRAVAVDANDDILALGATISTGWVSGGVDTSYDATDDGFLVRLTANGTHVWSTYVCDHDDFESPQQLVLDATGNLFVAGTAHSQEAASGYHNAFVEKRDSLGRPLWTVELGGDDGHDYGWDLAVDAAGNVYLIGQTFSDGWTTRGFDTSYGGMGDAFFARLGPTGETLWSTYLGGDGEDEGLGIAVDPRGDLLVAGGTASAGWAMGGFDVQHDAALDGFVARVTAAGDHVWSSYLGASDHEKVFAVAAAPSGDLVVAGYTASGGWLRGGFDDSHAGLSDAFLARISDPHPIETYTRRDLAVLVSNWGRASGVTAADGDLNHDGRVGLADLVYLQARFVDAAAAPTSAVQSPRAAAVDMALSTPLRGTTRLPSRRKPAATAIEPSPPDGPWSVDRHMHARRLETAARDRSRLGQ